MEGLDVVITIGISFSEAFHEFVRSFEDIPFPLKLQIKSMVIIIQTNPNDVIIIHVIEAARCHFICQE